LPGQFDGGISDVYEKEYPLITAAHKTASDEVACVPVDAPLDPTVFDWDTRLGDSLPETVRTEMLLVNMQNKSIQYGNQNRFVLILSKAEPTSCAQ
jgi:hypothetical protein